MTTREDRLLILDRLSKGEASTRHITGSEAGHWDSASGTRVYSAPRWPIPPVELSMGYTAVLALLHKMEQEGLIKHSTRRVGGNTLYWKLTSAGERQLEAVRRETSSRD